MQNAKPEVLSIKNAANEVAGNQAAPARSVESIRHIKAHMALNMCCTSGGYK